MANDRLYLRCPVCDQGVMLAKFWGAGDYAVRPQLVDELEAFLNEHAKDCVRQWGMRLDGKPGFTLETEDGPAKETPAPDEKET